MLVLAHPHGASSSGYCPAGDVAPALTVASLKTLNSCYTLASATKENLGSSVLQPASLTIPLHPPQLHLQPHELLPIAVQGSAGSASGSLYPSATIGVSGLLPCAPAVVGSGPLQQPLLPQLYVSQLPTFPAPSVCVPPPAKGCTTAPNKASKERQRLLQKKTDCVQRAWSEALCEREDKLQQQYASTVDQRQQERQQRDQQQPPLWRVPVVRDPLAAAAADFSPIPVSEATLVRHLWKHAHAAVEDPTSTPPFRWTPSLTQPHPSYWTDLRQHSRRPGHEPPAQAGDEPRADDCGGGHQHQYMHEQGNSWQNSEEERVETDLRRATDERTHRSRRKRSSSTASRRSHKQSHDEGEWHTGEGPETTTQYGYGDEDEEQNTVLSTRVGRSQSPAYICPRKDDFTAEQLIDAPAYTTNHIGLFSDTGMHYTKRYELPTISRFLQAKHPVFLRARTSGDERQEQSRSNSRDAVRARPSRGYGHGRQGEREEGSNTFTSGTDDKHAADGGVSYVLRSVSPVDTPSAILLHPQTHLQPEQKQIIIPATQLPTILWPPQMSPGALTQQHPLEFTGTAARGLQLQTANSVPVPTVTAVTGKPLTPAAAPLVVVTQPTITCLQTALQPGEVCPTSELPSLQSGPTFAAPLSPPPLYVQAPTRQESSARTETQSTPEACSSTAVVHSTLQAPHATVYAAASPPASSAVAVEAPRFTPPASEAQTDAIAPGYVAVSNPLPTQYSADFHAVDTCSAVDHTRGAEMPAQPQQHEQWQTQTLRSQEKRGEFGSQQQGHEQQQEETSDPRGAGSMRNSSEHEQPGLQQPQQQQHPVRDFTQGHRPLQPEPREQFWPQRHVVGREPQSDQERGSSCQTTAAAPRYLLTAEQPHLLLTPFAGIAPHGTAVCSAPILPREADDVTVTEVKPAAFGLPVAQDGGGVRAMGTLPPPHTIITFLAGSPLHSGTPIHAPQVSTPPGICQSLALLPAGRPDASGSASPLEPRVQLPPERHRESNLLQWGVPRHSLMTCSSTACVATPTATCIPTTAPMTHVLLQQQQGQRQTFIPSAAVAGPGQ